MPRRAVDAMKKGDSFQRSWGRGLVRGAERRIGMRRWRVAASEREEVRVEVGSPTAASEAGHDLILVRRPSGLGGALGSGGCGGMEPGQVSEEGRTGSLTRIAAQQAAKEQTSLE